MMEGSAEKLDEESVTIETHTDKSRQVDIGDGLAI